MRIPPFFPVSDARKLSLEMALRISDDVNEFLEIEMGEKADKSDPSSVEKRLHSFLSRHPEIRTAILFGSLVSGKADFYSDIDIAVEADQKLTAEEKMRLIGELAELTGRPVDLIDLRTVGEPLLGQILRTGKRLKGSSMDFAEIVKRHLFAEADFVPYQKRILAERRRAWLGR